MESLCLSMKLKPGNEIFLWCDGKDEDAQTAVTKHSSQEGNTNKQQAREEEIDKIVKELKEKHYDNYTTPQLRLWACMIASGIHDDMDDPPRVPMIIGAPIPKKQNKSKKA